MNPILLFWSQMTVKNSPNRVKIATIAVTVDRQTLVILQSIQRYAIAMAETNMNKIYNYTNLSHQTITNKYVLYF